MVNMLKNFFKTLAVNVIILSGLQQVSAEEWTARWMEQYAGIIGDKALNKIIIPGTHDSITYSINSRSKFAREQDVPHQLNWLRYAGVGFIVTKIAADWSKAQERTVTQQLQDGIRYFDMRVVYRDSENRFYTCHGLYGEELSAVLRQINAFLESHPKEVIILDFNHLYNMLSDKTGDKHPELISLIQRTFGNKLAPNDMYKPTSSLNEFWQNKHQVITLYYNDKGRIKESEWSKTNNLLWGVENIWSPWANKQNITDLKDRLDFYLTKDPSKFENKFFVLQGILTPDGQTIAGSFKPTFRGIRSLKDFSMQVRQPMAGWLYQWKKENKNINIVMMDFLDDKKLIGYMIQLNLIQPNNQNRQDIDDN